MTVTETEQIPLFTEEGPTWYNAAFEYHRPWSLPGPYQTPLSPSDESDFQDWVDTWDVPFDVTASIVDYDMRGYWVARVKGTSIGHTLGEHFPDFWKTPYDTTFSSESLYAKTGCPYHWHGEKLINDKTGQLIFWANYRPTKPSAVDIMEKSRINPAAITKGLMGDDLDLENFSLYVSGKLKLKSPDRVLDATLNRTIDGASTITFEILDDDRALLRSGLLSKMLDLKLDGMWWRLVQVGKQGEELRLVFETREIALLRMRDTPLVVSRDHTTRAEFVLKLIRELPFKVPVVIPELHIVQAVEGVAPTSVPVPGTNNNGIPTDLPPANDPFDIIADPRRNLTVKGEKARPDQISNVNTILGVGVSMGCRRKVLVASLMTGTQESSLTNLPGGDRDSAGVFQQRPSAGWGTYEQVTNVRYAAGSFFRKAIIQDRENPNFTYGQLCQAVQISAFPNAYDQWRAECENWVTAYTLSKPTATVTDTSLSDLFPQPVDPAVDNYAGGGSRSAKPSTGMDGFFYRGVPGASNKDWGPEDSWTCIQRLANEVNWRAFFVGGTFWYLDDTALFSMKPIMVITESSVGIDKIDGDYDRGKKVGTVDLRARMGRWLAPPGSVVQLQQMGVFNGKWLTNEFERSLFDLTADIVLKKPRPELPEPASIAVTPPATGAGGQTGSQPGSPQPPSVVTPDSIVIPPVAPATHCTSGLRGYPAVDWAINSDGDQISGTGQLGSPCFMQEGGTISNVHLIPWTTGFGGITFYMTSDSGRKYFVTHLDESSPVREGRVPPMTLVGYTVKNPINAGMINGAHVHVGCTGYTGLDCGEPT